MAAYIEKVLEPGERVAYHARLSPVSYLPSIALLVIGVLIVFAGASFVPLQYLGYLVAIVAVLWAAALWLRRAATEIAVTDRRVILKTGLISRRTVEINLTRVESVDVRQSIAGRVLNFGDVVIRGTGAGVEPLHMIEAPLEFRRRILS